MRTAGIHNASFYTLTGHPPSKESGRSARRETRVLPKKGAVWRPRDSRELVEKSEKKMTVEAWPERENSKKRENDPNTREGTRTRSTRSVREKKIV